MKCLLHLIIIIVCDLYIVRYFRISNFTRFTEFDFVRTLRISVLLALHGVCFCPRLTDFGFARASRSLILSASWSYGFRFFSRFADFDSVRCFRFYFFSARDVVFHRLEVLFSTCPRCRFSCKSLFACRIYLSETSLNPASASAFFISAI